MRAHRRDGRHVAGHAAGAARVAGVEAHHAGRRAGLLRRLGAGVGGVLPGGRSELMSGARDLLQRVGKVTASRPLEDCEECCVGAYAASAFAQYAWIQSFIIVVSRCHCRERTAHLDVPDLRLDLRRSRRRPGAWPRPRDRLERCADELDLPRMRRAQGRFRDGADLSRRRRDVGSWRPTFKRPKESHSWITQCPRGRPQQPRCWSSTTATPSGAAQRSSCARAATRWCWPKTASTRWPRSTTTTRS